MTDDCVYDTLTLPCQQPYGSPYGLNLHFDQWYQRLLTVLRSVYPPVTYPIRSRL